MGTRTPEGVGQDDGAAAGWRTGSSGEGSLRMAVVKVRRFSSHPKDWASSDFTDVPDGLEAFSSELEAFSSEEVSRPVVPPEADAPQQPVVRARIRVPAGPLWTAVLILVAGIAAVGGWQFQRQSAPATTGSLTIDTTPAGADVLLAGKRAGRTPFAATLAVGAYDVQVSLDGQKRDLAVKMAAGASIYHQLEFAAPVPGPGPATGSLHVQTDVRPAVVLLDGVERGTSPLRIADLGPGDHQVIVRGDRWTARRTIQIKPRETLSLVISPAESTAVLPGWLTVASPIVMQLRQEGRMIGTTETDRLMLPSGEHELEFSSDVLGYRTTRKVTIASGKVTSIGVELPTGQLNVNALPWAEVWIDGERVGETPLANLSRRIGRHQIVFRHPQFGERTETIVVPYQQPARLGVDMRR
jgi:PEGA domain